MSSRVALATIIALGVLLRGLYLLYAWNTPGYVWEDPDGYALQALKLVGPDGWRWTFRAVTYTINGQPHALPPLYSVFLSLFALFPGFPASVQFAQILLSGVAIWLVFALGRLIHSSRAGLIAASAYALWVPNIFGVWSTSQELLYIPLILTAFLVFGRAIQADSRPLAFAVAGALFGAAALTRSMPLFFAIPAAIAHIGLARDRRRAAIQGAAFLAGFVLLTGPYSAALSQYRGQLTVIDTHGSIHVAAPGGGRTPGLVETARALLAEVAQDPMTFVRDSLARARSLLHVNGGRILQIYVVAGSKAAAMAWKALVHVGSDVLLIAGAMCAALGAALCREPRVAALFVLWAAINIGIASAGGFGGARLRTPFEPMLFVLTAVVWAGTWQRPRPLALLTAIVVGVAAAVAVVPQIPRSLASWPDYGMAWPSIFSRQAGHFTGTAGLNLPAPGPVAVLIAAPAGNSSPQLEVRARGVHTMTVQLNAGASTSIRVLWPHGGNAFVELATKNGAGEISHETVHITVPAR